MAREESIRAAFEQTAKESKLFWEEVRARFSSTLDLEDDKYRLLDIQQVRDDCLDLIMVRSNDDQNLDQIENWRLTVERTGVFKKPKIRMNVVSGPFLSEFLKGGREQPLSRE